MKKMKKQIAIIGGGSAGMSAAIAAYKSGVKDIIIIERNEFLGGIVTQCIHNGFGLHKFNEELTGPEYAWKYEKQIKELGICYELNTTVIDITSERVITAVSPERGIFEIEADAIILAMGCRERSKGALEIVGERPAGIFSAGTAQKLVNKEGYMPGKKVLIVGSGDIGLIMARRMTLEGAKVEAVCEINSYSSGLARNIEQCLNDFDIPLLLSTTVKQVHGKDRVSAVTLASLDENKRIIEGTERVIECDTILFSVGLIPENELTVRAGVKIDRITNGAICDQNRETSVEGIFSAGNVLHVHDLVDYVSNEAEIAGESAAKRVKGELEKDTLVEVETDGRIRYTVPQIITKNEDASFYFRVAAEYRNVTVTVKNENGETVYSKKKAKVTPGEMETLKLDASAFSKTQKLYFGLEEAK